MGSRIAAHFANAGVPALLLDLTTKDAQRGIDTAIKQNPGAFFTPAAASLVTSGSFDDNLPAIKDCDWVIEAVTENLGIKRDLWTRVEQQRKPGAILSTNTSGIPLEHICDGFPQDFRRNFLGTHFFNPPRYLHLVEVIPGPETAPRLLDRSVRLLRRSSRQRRRALQGHTELHRQSHRIVLRSHNPQDHHRR